MEITPEIEKIAILIYLGLLFMIAIVVVSAYNEYCELVKNENKDLNPGGWVGGTYWANPEVFVPINESHENQNIQKVIDRHTKAVRIFWVWVALILPMMIMTFTYF